MGCPRSASPSARATVAGPGGDAPRSSSRDALQHGLDEAAEVILDLIGGEAVDDPFERAEPSVAALIAFRFAVLEMSRPVDLDAIADAADGEVDLAQQVPLR
jgi:hypothetical protein